MVGTASYGISRPDVCAAFPGRPSCPNVGFSYTLNTSSLGVGAHTLTVTAVDSDVPTDSGSASVPFSVAAIPPTLAIDSPTPSSNVSGVVMVSGWAIDYRATIGTVQVQVDGVTVGTATYGSSRPDVCSGYSSPGCPNVGFTYALNTTTMTSGSHTIKVVATDTETSPQSSSLSRTVTVTSQPPAIYTDSPSSGAIVSGTVPVSGWAIDNLLAPGTAIANIDVLMDGVRVGSATYGVSRPDVCAAYPGRPSCPNVGFSYLLNTTPYIGGSHTLTVKATDSDTTPDSASWAIPITVADWSYVAIDSPAPSSTVSGMVTVSGWAIDNSSKVTSVQVQVDGVTVGAATYGIARPDVCAVYSAPPSCPNVGYTYALNLASFTPGIHTITVVASSSSGSNSAARIINISATTPSVYIDSPSPGAVVSGTVPVTGWAIDGPLGRGTRTSTIAVLVDGVPVGTTIYGQRASDVCAPHAGRPSCPKATFSYGLDTTTLTSGSHTLTVKAVDGDSTTDLNSWAIPITILK